MSTKSSKKAASVASSSRTRGTSLLEKLRQLGTRQVSYNEDSGEFITYAQLKALESQLDDLMRDGQTSLSPTTLIDMQNQITDLVRRAEKAERALKNSEKAAAGYVRDIESMKKDKELIEKASKAEKTAINLEKEELKAKLKDLVAKQKQSVRQASDPDEVKERAKQISELQQQLAVKNAEYSAANSRVAEVTARLKAAEDQLTTERLLAQRYKKAAFAPEEVNPPDALNLKDEPLKPLEIDEFSSGATFKKVFSGEAKEALLKAAEARRNNVREYAYQLLMFAGQTDPKNFVGYRDYVNIAFNKVKSATHKKRAKYLPALDALYASMALKEGSKLREVKEQFSELFGSNDAQAEKTRKRVAEDKASWWDCLKFDFRKGWLSWRASFSAIWKKMPSFRSVWSFFHAGKGSE